MKVVQYGIFNDLTDEEIFRLSRLSNWRYQTGVLGAPIIGDEKEAKRQLDRVSNYRKHARLENPKELIVIDQLLDRPVDVKLMVRDAHYSEWEPIE